jgi:hypothetical protein
VFHKLGGNHDTQVQISHPNVDLGLPRTYRREKTVLYVRTSVSKWKVVSISWTLGGSWTMSFYSKITKDDSSISISMIGGLQG